MELKIILSDNGLFKTIENIGERLSNLSPVLEKMGAVAAADVRKNFTEKGRYDSPDNFLGGTKKWEPHSEATKKIKESKGLKGPYSLLVESGRLVKSISSEVENANTVAVGTNVEYARRMHYGSKKGEFEILVKAHIRRRKVAGSNILKSGKPGKTKNMNINTSVRAHIRKSPFIPARPFMNIQPETVERISRILSNFILSGE